MGEQAERFGDLLRRYRETAGCSQEELAERAGLSKNAIGTLERGERRHPYLDTLRRLAAALGLNEAERGSLAAAARAADGSPPNLSRTTEPAGSARPSLPQYGEALIGRGREVEETLRFLRQPNVRLLTLTGTGGVGKTRLAVEVARRALAHVADGVAFVPLALVQDPRLVIPTIARTLGLRESGKRALRETLHGYLRDKELLLVLDNCEHLLQGSWIVQEMADLLVACPRIRVVATSRAPLRLHGEQEYLVPPLSVPPPDALSRTPLSVEDMARVASVQLFVRRAQQVSSAFALTPSNTRPIADICRRLDGLPLAIELASRRVRILPPAELLARLDHALQLLTGGARDRPERQQTMRAAISWSYELLEGREKTLFQRLAVFAGGWTLEAAEAVGADAGEAAEGAAATEGILEALCGLVEQSLVVGEQAPELAPRYWMLEPVRQYAAERFEQSGEANAVRSRHAAYYLRLAEQGDSQLRQATQLIWLDRLEEEHANLRAALTWLLEEGESEASLRLAGALGWFWFIRGYVSEGRMWLGRALRAQARAATDVTGVVDVSDGSEATGALSRPRAQALHRAGMLAWLQGDFPAARQQLEESLMLSRTRGNEAGAALALACLAAGTQDRREYPVLRAQLEKSVTLLREAGDKWVAAFALSFLGHGLFEPDAEMARSRNLESARLFREVGDRWGTGFATMKLGEAALNCGEYDAALTYFEESLSLHRELRDGLSVAVALTNLGEVARLRGDSGRAEANYREALARFEEVGGETDIPRLLHNLGRVARQRGDGARAWALLGESLTNFRRQGFHRGVAECVAGYAGLAVDRNEPERAAVLLGWVEVCFRALGTSMWPADRAEFDRDVTTTRGQLSESRFEEAWATGGAMAYDEVIAYVLISGQPRSGTDGR
jgi:predicted ATPase/DNA-binding XRE family transcriptional regulator